MHAMTSLWVVSILGQADGSAVKVNSILDFLQKGGPMMIPIGICSLIALTVVIERLICMRRKYVIPPRFFTGLKEALGEDGSDHEAALEYCQADGSSVANILSAGIKRLGDSVERIEKSIKEAGEREIIKLRKYFRVLSVVAAIAPLMGLLGTIFGMIIAFQTVATAGEALGKAELLAKGIYQAMITTAAGLSLAIPVLIIYHFLHAKAERLVLDMDKLTVDFLEDYAYSVQSASGDGPTLRATDDVAGAGKGKESVKSMASA